MSSFKSDARLKEVSAEEVAAQSWVRHSCGQQGGGDLRDR